MPFVSDILSQMAPKHSSEILSGVLKCKKAGMCSTDKNYIIQLTKLPSGIHDSAGVG